MNKMNKKTFGTILINSITDAIQSPSKGRMVNTVNVADIRKRLHMSQTDFAKEYHINVKTLRQWEQGLRNPDLTSLAYLECISKAPEQIRNILNH